MIIFNYKISDIINNAQVLSIYRSGSLLDKGTENVVDDTALSDEDESLLKKFLISGCAMVANTLSGYIKDLINSQGNKVLMEGEPFEFDVTYGEGEDAVEHSIVFRINMPETWPTSYMMLIDNSIKEALENYILYRVSKLKLIEGDTFYSDFEISLGNIRGYLQRRSKSTVRNYNTLN